MWTAHVVLLVLLNYQNGHKYKYKIILMTPQASCELLLVLLNYQNGYKDKYYIILGVRGQ
jgi:hypothetical protein